MHPHAEHSSTSPLPHEATIQHPGPHRHGGTQEGSGRAQQHLQDKTLLDHHQTIDTKHLAKATTEAKIELERTAPSEYVNKRLATSELVNGISPQRGSTETTISELDKGTPDAWVPRNNELIRLVGRHPMNAEPPLAKLINAGLITPNRYHYVRNHGSVPKIEESDHKLKILGLVDKPKELTVGELKQLNAVNILVSLICDGNRRKELNTIKKSRGFGWGAGGAACAYWKGVLLCDILKACGVKGKESGAKFVCFEGADKLTEGTYGTSIPLSYVMDETNDVLVAYEMNNEPIPPDHGFPLRLVVPGFVGGRQIKWLREINVTDRETTNYYHWHDNKVLPPTVDSTEAVEEGWFYNPNFTLYELNIQSVITSPSHGTRVTLGDSLQHPTLVEGYAYSGGGRKITRVEVSLDGGRRWGLAQIIYPHNTPRHDCKYWTWCHWMLHVESWRVIRCAEIVVRAFDASCNTQPSEPTWNLLGMMNNAWYRVKVEVKDHPTPVDPDVAPSLTFVHPVMPGDLAGGWMIRPSDQPLRPKGAAWDNKKYTMKEVQHHNTKESGCWFVFRGSVYNVTSYLHDHPSGAAAILANAGGDATLPFEMAHGADAYKFLDQFKIGEIADLSPSDTDGYVWAAGAREIGNVEPLPPSTVALDPKEWLNLKLTKREDISPDTRVFTFQRDKAHLPLGLPIGQYVLLAALIDNKLVARPYTPVRPVFQNEDKGEVKFVIKVYFPEGDKPGGQMTMFLEEMEVGQIVKLRGPYGHVVYKGNGNFLIHGTPLYGNRISLIAGGSGITPCYQIIRKVLCGSNDSLLISLIFANKSVDDILLKKELDELAEKHDNFKLWYVVDTAPEGQEWKYSTGHITYEIIKEHAFPAAPNSFAFVCGPPRMIEQVCLPNLDRLGFDFNNLVEF